MEMRTIIIAQQQFYQKQHFMPHIQHGWQKKVASIVSVNGGKTRKSPPMSAKMGTTGVGGRSTKNPEAASSKAVKAKGETVDYGKLSIGSNSSSSSECDNIVKSRLEQQQLKLQLQSKGIKIYMELYRKLKQ